jgi:hypothetical protein
MVRIRTIVGLIVAVMASQAAAKHVDVRDPARRERVVASLREAGQNGLDAALAAYDALQKQQATLQEAILRYESDSTFDDVSYGKSSKATAPEDRLASDRRRMAEITAQLEAWRTAIDEIGSQRGCSVSRMYWYTDLAEARAAAERTGRPILSLRMLGKLTDEYSCANSRFFRTALYSNKEISDYLRDNYVLHWQSVRPVPRVTIDFGDGRKLERTLTGNSAHYVLASSGEPLDVLPGLYSPQAFKSWLKRSHELARQFTSATNENAKSSLLRDYHVQQHRHLQERWQADIEKVAPELLHDGYGQLVSRDGSQSAEGLIYVDAVEAARLAESKGRPELPILRAIAAEPQKTDRMVTDKLWERLAALHRPQVKLDEQAVAMMRVEFPRAEQAGRAAVSKTAVEDPIVRMVRRFEDSIALDTVRNEYLLHRRIHERFARIDWRDGEDQPEIADLDTLNEWVYAELFLTPSADPWLGLAPRDVYTALDNDGRTEPATTVASRSRR